MSTFAVKADKFFCQGAISGPGYLLVEGGVFGHFIKEKPDRGLLTRTGCGTWPYTYPWLPDHDIMVCDPDGVIEITQVCSLTVCNFSGFQQH